MVIPKLFSTYYLVIKILYNLIKNIQKLEDR